MNFFDLFLGIILIIMAIFYIMDAIEDKRNDEKVRMWIDIAIAVLAAIAAITDLTTFISSILPG